MFFLTVAVGARPLPTRRNFFGGARCGMMVGDDGGGGTPPPYEKEFFWRGEVRDDVVGRRRWGHAPPYEGEVFCWGEVVGS